MEQHWDIIIENKSRLFSLNLKEVWRYRDLLVMYVKRDIVTFYKQTILGPAWFFIQPILTTIMFMFVFGGIAGISTDGVPQAVFYLAGLVCWNYFADCLTKCSDTFNANQQIFGKVYFPRLVVPFSIVISNMIKLGIQFLLFFVVYLYYAVTLGGFNVNWTICLLPLLILMLACIGLGFGLVISSMTTNYPDKIWLIVANPLTAITETFKYGFTGVGVFEWSYLLYSLAFAVVVLLLGIMVFNRVQKNFMDVI